MPDERASISEKPSAKFPTTPPERPRLNRHLILAPDRLVCHPSGMKNDLFTLRDPGVSLRSTPG
jgi:hypothetical protein